MAENKIVIGVRIDRKQAEADLRALKADVTKTTRDLAALDKQITSASGKKLKPGGHGGRQRDRAGHPRSQPENDPGQTV